MDFVINSMNIMLAFVTIDELLAIIQTVVTFVLALGGEAITFIETTLATSFLLQITLAIGAVPLGFIILQKVIRVLKSFIRK